MGPNFHGKPQLQDLKIYALSWCFKKRHLTSHTSHTLNTSLTTILFTPLTSHTPHCHEPTNTHVCLVSLQYTDTKSLFTPLLSPYTLHSAIISSRF